MTKDKKIVAFVGTSKNGTSFLVNNLGALIASMGIKVAILDLAKNKNAYYVYTNNEEELRKIASESITKLNSGVAEGIKINKNLSVYTATPGQDVHENVEKILSTLVQNYSLVLIDCDFDTNAEYLRLSQEIYLVQSMDVLTIQPLTEFLRDLKAKNILQQNKIKIVINKSLKVKGLSSKVIVGGMSFYNDPAMSYMTELFDRENVKYCEIPFEEQSYSLYLEGLLNCSITLNGYSKIFLGALKELSNMVYPLIGGGSYKPDEESPKNNKFSSQMNNTLDQMKNKF